MVILFSCGQGQDAFLQGANLRDALLQGADFQGANLRGANLQDADLGGAKAITGEQLCQASILYEAILDQELIAQIKNDCPDLLREPQATVTNTSGKKN